MLRNDAMEQRLRVLERALAVLIFALVLFQMYQSSKVGITPRGTPAREALQHLHIANGLSILLLLVPRLWLWMRLPRPSRPTRVPAPADDLARRCTLGLYLTLAAFCLTGPLFAWSEGHAVAWFGGLQLPALLPASYRASVTLGYLHSATGFFVIVLFGFTVLVGLWQALRYRIGPWRLLPGFDWGGGPVHERSRTPAGWQIAHAACFLVLVAMAAYAPYKIFGVIPLTTDRQWVEAAPPPAVDPYADVGVAPVLSGQTQQDFM